MELFAKKSLFAIGSILDVGRGSRYTSHGKNFTVFETPTEQKIIIKTNKIYFSQHKYVV